MDDLAIEQQPRAVDLAMFARQQGAVGVAITKLAEAEASGDSLALVKPQLLDLYCSTGQPDKAQELLNVGSIGDPNLGSEPGIATYRQGLVYYLLGNYLSTASLWNERSLPQVRMERSSRILMAGKSFTRGELMQATNQFLGIPESLDRQATWEFDVAICQLEAGLPDAAAEHFTKSLTLEPEPDRPADRGLLPREDGQARPSQARGPRHREASPARVPPRRPRPSPSPPRRPHRSPSPPGHRQPKRRRKIRRPRRSPTRAKAVPAKKAPSRRSPVQTVSSLSAIRPDAVPPHSRRIDSCATGQGPSGVAPGVRALLCVSPGGEISGVGRSGTTTPWSCAGSTSTGMKPSLGFLARGRPRPSRWRRVGLSTPGDVSSRLESLVLAQPESKTAARIRRVVRMVNSWRIKATVQRVRLPLTSTMA